MTAWQLASNMADAVDADDTTNGVLSFLLAIVLVLSVTICVVIRGLKTFARDISSINRAFVENCILGKSLSTSFACGD